MNLVWGELHYQYRETTCGVAGSGRKQQVMGDLFPPKPATPDRVQLDRHHAP